MDVVRDWLENVGGSWKSCKQIIRSAKSMFGSFAGSEFLGIFPWNLPPRRWTISFCSFVTEICKFMAASDNVACSCGKFALVLTNGLKTNVLWVGFFKMGCTRHLLSTWNSWMRIWFKSTGFLLSLLGLGMLHAFSPVEGRLMPSRNHLDDCQTFRSEIPLATVIPVQRWYLKL